MKYEIIAGQSLIIGNVTLYRIRALRDIPFHGVCWGDEGGFIQSGANLSQEGDCWIDESSRVYGKARVSGDAKIMLNSQVCQRAQVNGQAVVQASTVRGTAIVSGARLVTHAILEGNSKLI